MSVRRCMVKVDSLEFAEWSAMYELDPWGDDRIERAVVSKKIYQPPKPPPSFAQVASVFSALRALGTR